MSNGSAPERHREVPRWIPVLAAAVGVALLVAALHAGFADLLMPAGGKQRGLDDLRKAIGNIKGPATAAFGSVSGLGLLAGGALTAMGMPQGIRMMTMSGLAGGGVLLGNGIVA